MVSSIVCFYFTLLDHDPFFQHFLESINPFPDYSDKEITDYLWEKSIEIEPKGADPALKKKITVSFSHEIGFTIGSLLF